MGIDSQLNKKLEALEKRLKKEQEFVSSHSQLVNKIKKDIENVQLKKNDTVVKAIINTVVKKGLVLNESDVPGIIDYLKASHDSERAADEVGDEAHEGNTEAQDAEEVKEQPNEDKTHDDQNKNGEDIYTPTVSADFKRELG